MTSGGEEERWSLEKAPRIQDRENAAYNSDRRRESGFHGREASPYSGLYALKETIDVIDLVNKRNAAQRSHKPRPSPHGK